MTCANNITLRAREVVRRAAELGVPAGHNPPMVRLNGKSYIVSHAEAWLDGYEADPKSGFDSRPRYHYED